MQTLLEKLYKKEHLNSDEISKFFNRIVRGEVDEITLSSLLTALKIKGETPEEIAGAALSLRKACTPFEVSAPLFADSCGTGGDKSNTINVSTLTAFLAAECGLPMVKHGNRSVTSKCGSADVLEHLGATIDLSPNRAQACFEKAGITFLFAPRYHPGIKHAMNVRKTLATRTIFNVLGPLINPARPSIQVLGVFDPALTNPLAETLKLLGTKTALVVHGSGLDEIALHDVTTASLLMDGKVSDLTISPEDLGLNRSPIAAFEGGSVEVNAEMFVKILQGQGSDEHNQLIAANTGPLLYLAGLATDMKDGVGLAYNTLESGRAYARFLKFVEATKMEAAA